MKCAARVPYSVCCLQTEFFLFPHFTKPDRKIRPAFRNSVFPKKSDHFVKSQTFLSKTKSKTLSPTAGNHGYILAARSASHPCVSVSHDMSGVRDKIHYVGYASIQCVRWREKESPRLVMLTDSLLYM